MPGIEAWIDEACAALHSDGWYCRCDAFPAALVELMSLELDALIEEDRLHPAGIGRDLDFQLAPDVRRDWIFWLNRSRPRQAAFLDEAEAVRLALNQRLFLGLFEFEAHLALYPPGAFYRRHFDSFAGAANRMVSLVLYLNRGWQPGDGGELVLFGPAVPGSGIGRSECSQLARIEPHAGTLALFLSEEIEHEVLETRTDRASIAGWYRLNASTAEVVDPPR